MLLVDLLVVHHEAHEVKTKEAAIESAVWIGCRLSRSSLVVWWWFGGAATGEYVSGYLIEKSLSIDNVFVWALIMGYFRVPQKYQHRVLFWGIFGALVMRADLHLRRRRRDRTVRLGAVRVRWRSCCTRPASWSSPTTTTSIPARASS